MQPDMRLTKSCSGFWHIDPSEVKHKQRQCNTSRDSVTQRRETANSLGHRANKSLGVDVKWELVTAHPQESVREAENLR